MNRNKTRQETLLQREIREIETHLRALKRAAANGESANVRHYAGNIRTTADRIEDSAEAMTDANTRGVLYPHI